MTERAFIERELAESGRRLRALVSTRRSEWALGGFIAAFLFVVVVARRVPGVSRWIGVKLRDIVFDAMWGQADAR